MDQKSPDAFRTISEVADDLDIPQHVLRFWETRFRDIKPLKRGGGRRYYRPDDVDLLRGIRHLLYGEGYTIRGVQRILHEQGTRFVQGVWQAGAPQPDHHNDLPIEQAAPKPRAAAPVSAPVSTPDDEEEDETRLEVVDEDELLPATPPRAEPQLTPHGPSWSEVSALGPASHAAAYDLPYHDIGRSAPQPEMRREPVFSAPPPSPVAIPVAVQHETAPYSGGPPRLPREDLRRLQSALHELVECQRLISLAVSDDI